MNEIMREGVRDGGSSGIEERKASTRGGYRAGVILDWSGRREDARRSQQVQVGEVGVGESRVFSADKECVVVGGRGG